MGREGGGAALAARRVTVTLAMARGPGFPEGSPERRYELRVILDQRGCLDAEAWAADPEPWPVRRIWPGEPDRYGDVQYDPDSGWSLRLFGGSAPSGAAAPGGGGAAGRRAADLSDAPLQQLFHTPGTMRPGEYVSITEPDGREFEYRIVGVG